MLMTTACNPVEIRPVTSWNIMGAEPFPNGIHLYLSFPYGALEITSSLTPTVCPHLLGQQEISLADAFQTNTFVHLCSCGWGVVRETHPLPSPFMWKVLLLVQPVRKEMYPRRKFNVHMKLFPVHRIANRLTFPFAGYNFNWHFYHRFCHCQNCLGMSCLP